MITRIFTILVAASLVYSQYIPLSSIGDDNDCALYLTGPGRTSAYDYNLNLLRGSFPYDGQHTCITYDAVNQAYIDARKRINVATPKGDWKTEDIASVGELMLDISINLARTYGLTYEDIEKGLPLIDTSKTLIREVCPPFLSHVECRAGKYRRFDGLCTNLKHPTWGASMTPFQRLIAPLYSDGINAPRVSVTGRDLPLSRIVSRTMHPDEGFHDHAGTVMVIAWGQFMDHDYTLTGTPLDPFNRNDPEECCNRPPHLKHPYCNELIIPDDDYFYRLFNVKCIDFVRGFPSPRAGCRLGSRQQFNTLTGVLDGNTVYGVSEKFARKLRSGVGGLLRMNPVFSEYGLKDLLPLKLDIPDEGCTRPNKSMYCFEAGEIRVNEQLVLTCMHTLMAREHNRVAKGLAEVNPHWDDETLFQEARRIVIAEIQHITYNEFLPILLGKEVMEKFGLLLNKEGYWDGYDENINPSVIDAFAAAAFRFGHSLLPTAVERWSKAHKFIASKRLSDLIRRPFDLYRAGIFDEYLMGLMNQVAQAMDDSITQEVTNHLFKKPGARFGMDLVSFNMQRGREFGLPGYMEFRKFCGLPAADSFQELFGSMPNETIQRYESIFEHPSDVDLWSGGVSERPLPGSMLGPTFACIIATQFSYSRRGDRFWFELPNQPSSFTPEQLQEVRKGRLARIMCDNTDIIDTVQLYPMVLPDHEINPRVPCRSGIIPMMDFTKWADYSGHVHLNPNPYGSDTLANFDKPQKVLNVTDTKSSTPLQKKSPGHYKNSLRRRKRDATELSNTYLQNATNATQQKHESVTDSVTAAIIVTQVSGSEQHDKDTIATTEAILLRDQRDDISPQTFTPKTTAAKDITVDDNEEFDLYDYFDFNQVSDTNQNKQNLKHGDEEVDDNEQEFIADKSRSENSDEEAEEITSTLPNNNRDDRSEENLENDKFTGEQILGYDRTSAEKIDDSNPRSDNSETTSDERGECSTGTEVGDSPDGIRGSSKHSKRVCETGGGRLESVNIDEEPKFDEESEKSSEELNLSQETLSENAKEQFEHIPLDYKHDEVTNKKKTQQIKHAEKLKPIIDLGDTSVNIDDIKLPDIVFQGFDDKYFEELRKRHRLENQEDEESDESSDDDDDYNDDEYYYNSKDDSAENSDSENAKNNAANTDSDEIPSQTSDNNKEKEEIRDYNENDDANDDDSDYPSEDSGDNQNNKKKAKEDDYEYNPGYEAFDISDIKDKIKDYGDGVKHFEYIIQDPSLKKAVEESVDKSKQTEKDVGSDDDPKYNYYWTLEYGQPV